MEEIKQSKKIIVTLPLKDYEELKKMALKERLSISGLVRHFIVKRIYTTLGIDQN
ncbi:MAG: hypothetical protein AB1775_03505 [Bacteroidota bacterium]